MGASSRMRTFQYLPLWKKEGVEVEVNSFFNAAYLTRFYEGKKPSIVNVLFCYLKRFWILLGAFRYDLIWIEKELFPFLPSYGEWILEKTGKGYVVDYDDAVFHNYDKNQFWLVRVWMGNKIDWVMRHAQLVFVGNSYLHQRAEKAGSKQILTLPTVVDVEKYAFKKWDNPQTVRLGWIGSPTTLKYLTALIPVFEKLRLTHEFELIIVNSDKVHLPEFPCKVTLLPWKEEEESGYIELMDIGLMPLPDSYWERGKCAYKLIQYMACGLPVVASPVGMNKDVVIHGENGYLASNPEEWEAHLTHLIESPALREKFGIRGHKRVKEFYTIDRNFDSIRSALKELLK